MTDHRGIKLSYILVTPILNEADNLQKLKEIVLNQTLKPQVWVIGDGGSTDKSYEIATRIFSNYPWIYIIKQKTFSEEGYSHKNFSNNVNDCIEYARKVCIDKNIEYNFVGKTDATPILSSDYFEILMNEMENNPKLAFTCGLQYIKRQHNLNGNIHDKRSYDVMRAFNDIRLYRRAFIEQMGGYPVSYFPDTELRIKALNRGWAVKRVDKTYFIIAARVGGSKIGFWNGYKLRGKAMYIIGYNPILLLLNALYYIKSYPYFLGLPLIYGYVLAFVKKEERTKDKEVIKYFWKDRPLQVAKGIFTEGDE